MNALSPLPSETPEILLEHLAIQEFQEFLHPLTEFADEPDAVERFDADGTTMPEPFRGLLVHESDMTSTLERFHSERPRLEVLARHRRGTSLFRQVLLRGSRTDRVVEYGAIRIELERLVPEARWAVLEGRRPLGGILADHRVSFLSRPRSFFSVRPGSELRRILGMERIETLYGRKNLLEMPDGGVLAEVVEILPPLARGSE